MKTMPVKADFWVDDNGVFSMAAITVPMTPMPASTFIPLS